MLGFSEYFLNFLISGIFSLHLLVLLCTVYSSKDLKDKFATFSNSMSFSYNWLFFIALCFWLVDLVSFKIYLHVLIRIYVFMLLKVFVSSSTCYVYLSFSFFFLHMVRLAQLTGWSHVVQSYVRMKPIEWTWMSYQLTSFIKGWAGMEAILHSGN
jgi:hypothetical protein